MATKKNGNRCSLFNLTCLTIISLVLSGCGTLATPVPTTIPTPKPTPSVRLSVSQATQEPAGDAVANVQEGEGVAIVVKVEPYESLAWTWSVSGTSGGTLNAKQGDKVVYTAGAKGVDIVEAEATTADGKPIKQQVTIYVEAVSSATDEVVVDTTPTAVPDPIACNLPPVTKNLFLQLADVNGQFPMYGPEKDQNILCQAVYDIVHTPGKMAVHFKYENVGKNVGWWGIATPKTTAAPNGYDASGYSQLCFWAYAQQPNQSFRVKMKDITKKEDGFTVTIEAPNKWAEICVEITKFKELGIQVEKMDNVNLGFEQPTGSAEIWVADFEFR